VAGYRHERVSERKINDHTRRRGRAGHSDQQHGICAVRDSLEVVVLDIKFFARHACIRRDGRAAVAEKFVLFGKFRDHFFGGGWH
jgi:hypothetical protein